MLQEVEAESFQTLQVHLLHIARRGFDHHLVLIIMLEAVGIFAVAPVSGAAGGLHIGGLPGFRPQGLEQSGRVKGSGTDFHVIGLHNNATGRGPVAIQGRDNILKIHDEPSLPC
ncbi:hypothetical protein H206_02897 [Candidatus Electrothrix aarhusensis]|uniref:Uncharacterized protein n=1 Tax=Candidatus Electrothrix aarhusensis TaxID=1859131 RepID=A0A444IQY2_9BACT|nr:hypothetical protein H206_02897 [Candidatus Electrothrix aarhusensis]